MNLSEFYEEYWQRPGGSPADFGFLLQERSKRLQKAVGGIPLDKRILDAGCGNGAFSTILADLGYEIHGIDIAKGAVDLARSTSSNDSFSVASVENGLPFENNLFAAIWSTEVLEHIFDVHAALAEFNRVLEPNGLLILTTPYHGLVKNLLVTLFGFERHYDPYVSHIRFFTRKSLGACLTHAGFSPQLWDGFGRRWPIWMSHFVVAMKIGEASAPPPIVG